MAKVTEGFERGPAYQMLYDWTMFTGMSVQGHFLYRVVSCLSESNPKGHPPTPITDRELCELIGQMIGRQISLRSLQRWRNELVDADLVRVTNLGPGSTPDTPKVYIVRRSPDPTWTGPVSFDDALADIRKSWGYAR